MNILDRESKHEMLKRQLFMAGTIAIEGFLGYQVPEGEDKDVTENRLDEAEMQMPDEEFERFYAKYVTENEAESKTGKLEYSDELVLFTSAVCAAAVLEHQELITIQDDESLVQACLDILSLYEEANSKALKSVGDEELPQFSALAEKELNRRFGPETKKACPRCGCTSFLVSAHVVQDWKVDGDGDFLECTKECVETTHRPDDDDLWTCARCGYDAAGSEFNRQPEDVE